MSLKEYSALGQGECIEYSCKEPSKFCSYELKTGIPYRRGKVLHGVHTGPENRDSWFKLLSFAAKSLSVQTSNSLVWQKPVGSE